MAISCNVVSCLLPFLRQAHKVLHKQAELLHSVFPPGMSMTELTEKARQRSNTAGAPDVLNFLRNHVAKLNNELLGQPGAPAPSAPSSSDVLSSPPAKTGRSAVLQESPSSGSGLGAGSPERGSAVVGALQGKATQSAMIKAVADGACTYRCQLVLCPAPVMFAGSRCVVHASACPDRSNHKASRACLWVLF